MLLVQKYNGDSSEKGDRAFCRQLYSFSLCKALHKSDLISRKQVAKVSTLVRDGQSGALCTRKPVFHDDSVLPGP